MEFKGTKGKWEVIEIKNGLAKGIYISCGKKFFLCKVNQYEDCFTIEEAKANALLISKAPEMLEMLNLFTDFPDEDFLENESEEFYTFSVKVKDMIKAKKLIKQATEL